ncbi:MAG: hypothetical protein ACOC3V_01415 [bacterium]
MKHLKSFYKLNENNYLGVSILTYGRQNTLEFEDLLHKSNYTWGDGRKYLLVTHFTTIENVLFVNIDKDDKIFTAYNLDSMNDVFYDTKFSHNIKLIYPQDAKKIANILKLYPTYEPKIIKK